MIRKEKEAEFKSINLLREIQEKRKSRPFKAMGEFFNTGAQQSGI